MTSPLVPANVDLRDFPYMPLDVVRLRDSRIVSHTTGEGFRCAVLLWCVSWHQVPAGSLPDDDVQLAAYAGFGRIVREWKKVRAEALHGWVLCDDNRWYHPTVAEKALEAWQTRLDQRWKTECARIKKAAQRSESKPIYPTFEQWHDHFQVTGLEQWRPNPVPGDNEQPVPGTDGDGPGDVLGETASKGREGKGREAFKSKSFTEASLQDLATEACALMREAGVVRFNPSHPDLHAAIREGVTLETLRNTAVEALAADDVDNPFTWAINTARGRHANGPRAVNGANHATSTRSGRGSAVDRVREKAEAGERRDRDSDDDHNVVRVIG